MPTLKERREVAAVKLLKNMLDEGHPLHDLVPPARTTATGKTLRIGTALTVPATRIKRLKNSFLHEAICLYNESLQGMCYAEVVSLRDSKTRCCNPVVLPR
ncbi:hypothetical protein Bbelb_039660 [Branchiostoma belcheri]|nr:hypothetical protein Bbelb_039660 [Branchiostoma belcheri]